MSEMNAGLHVAARAMTDLDLPPISRVLYNHEHAARLQLMMDLKAANRGAYRAHKARKAAKQLREELKRARGIISAAFALMPSDILRKHVGLAASMATESDLHVESVRKDRRSLESDRGRIR